MKWFLLFTGVVAGLILVALVVGLFLSESHTASVERRVPGDPDGVWRAMTTPGAFPDWRPGVDDVEVREEGPEGPTRWVERGDAGAMAVAVEAWEPPDRLVLRIAGDDLPFSGTWTCELAAEEDGTRVTLTEDGEIPNPFFRFVARFLLGHEATLRDYLEGLEGRMAGEGGGDGIPAGDR